MCIKLQITAQKSDQNSWAVLHEKSSFGTSIWDVLNYISKVNQD